MRISVVDTPRQVSYIPKYSHLIMRVITGAVLIAREQQTLTSGGGLPVAVVDNIVNLEWDIGPFWIIAAPGTVANVEVLIP